MEARERRREEGMEWEGSVVVEGRGLERVAHAQERERARAEVFVRVRVREVWE